MMPTSQRPTDVRLTALHLIQKWRRKPDVFVNDLIADVQVDPRELGLLRELISGVIRYQKLYEHLSNNLLKKNKNPQDLLDILSLAAHQVFCLDGIPDHAIGQTSVDLAVKIKKQKWKGVVNALVRKFIKMRDQNPGAEKPAIKFDQRPHAPEVYLSFPRLFIDDLQRDFPDSWEDIARALNQTPKLCTRWRNPKSEAHHCENSIRTEWPWVWWDHVQDALSGPIATGDACIQDRSQGHVIALAEPRAGEYVLDLCAAPGGKSLAAMDAGALVFSADINPLRMQKMRGINPGKLFVQDALHPACTADFDCVLLDAPCSNSGVFARRPEARWRYQRKQNQELARLQHQLLMHAANHVKVGGRLIYSTCSLNSEENQAISHSLEGWRVVTEHTAIPDQWQAGAYAARLERID